MLYPFVWQHTIVPVLPQSMTEIASAPTPFILGLLSKNVEDWKSIYPDQVFIIIPKILHRFFFLINVSFCLRVCWLIWIAAKSFIMSAMSQLSCPDEVYANSCPTGRSLSTLPNKLRLPAMLCTARVFYGCLLTSAVITNSTFTAVILATNTLRYLFDFFCLLVNQTLNILIFSHSISEQYLLRTIRIRVSAIF